MKKFIAILFAGALLASCGNEGETSNEGNSTEMETTDSIPAPLQVVEGYTHYGMEKVNTDSPLDINTFATALADGTAGSCTIKAELASICAKAGCFVIVDLPDSTQMRVMFKDHFTIPPKTEMGTEAIFTGEAKMDTTSIDHLRHYIEDEMEGEDVSAEKKAELQAKWDAITEPEIEPVFIATGILVKN